MERFFTYVISRITTTSSVFYCKLPIPSMEFHYKYVIKTFQAKRVDPPANEPLVKSADWRILKNPDKLSKNVYLLET